MSKHPLADVLIAIANGEPVEFKTTLDKWILFDPKLPFEIDPNNSNWRVKPKSIFICTYLYRDIPTFLSYKFNSHEEAKKCTKEWELKSDITNIKIHELEV